MKDPAAFDFDGNYGRQYDDLVVRVIPEYDRVFETTLRFFDQRLPGAARLLVVGAGTGKEITTLAPAQPGWSFVGVDPSVQMIEVTRRRVERAGLVRRVSLHHGYVDELNDTFDAATIINVMHFLPDDGAKAALLSAVACRVKPAAPVVLFDLHGDPGTESFERTWQDWIDHMAAHGFAGAERQQFLARLSRGIDYVPEARIRELCAAAGFAVETRFYRRLLYGGWLLMRRGPVATECTTAAVSRGK